MTSMTPQDKAKAEARKAALKIRAGADPTPYLVDGVLPDLILDQIMDLAAKGL